MKTNDTPQRAQAAADAWNSKAHDEVAYGPSGITKDEDAAPEQGTTETLLSAKSGTIMGTIAGNIVTTATGEKYEVSNDDIDWLKSRATSGLIESTDIKSVGKTFVAQDSSIATRCQRMADAWNKR